MQSQAETLPGFPEFYVYEVGNPWRRPRPAIARAVARIINGPAVPDGTVVDYRKLNISMSAARSWPRLQGKGDESSPGLPRTWPYAAHLAMPRQAVENLMKEYGEVWPAAGRIASSGRVVGGPLAEDAAFGEDEDVYTVLCRIGPRTTIEAVTPALILPETGLFLTPVKAEVLDDGTRIEKVMDLVRSGTPLI